MIKLILPISSILMLALTACASEPTPIASPEILTTTLALPTAMAAPPTPTPTAIPQGRTLLVTSAADNGPGTLRQAMLEVYFHPF